MMSNQLEQLTQNRTRKHLHRLRLRPLAEFLETKVTLKVQAIRGMRQEGDVLAAPSLEPEVTLKVQAIRGVRQEGDVLAAPSLKLEHLEIPPLSLVELDVQENHERSELLSSDKRSSRDGATDDEELFEEQATLPVQVLRNISSRQDQLAPEMKSEISGAASNGGIVGIGNIAGYAFKYGNNLLIQRSLGLAQFGLFSVSLSLVTLISSILDLGLDSAMIRYIAIYRGKRQMYLLRSLALFCTAIVGVTGMLGALMLFFWASSLASFLHKPETGPVLLIMAPLVPLLCLQTVWIGGLQGLKEFKKRVFVQRFLVPILVLLLLVVIVIFLPNIIWVAIANYVSALFSAIINLYFLLSSINRLGNIRTEGHEVRSWLSFAVPNFLTNIVNIVLDSIDTVLLAFFVVAAQIGLYAASIKISGFVLLPMFSLNVMFTPTIAELYAKGEKQKLEAMFKVVTHWTITLSLLIFCIAVVFAVPLLQISGNAFAAARPILVVLCIGSLISAGCGAVGNMLLMTGHQKISFFNSVSVVILNIVLGVILTPRYGAVGTAISTAMALGVVNMIRLVEVRILLKMHPYRWETLKPFGAALITSLLAFGLLYLLGLTHLSFQLSHYGLSIQLLLIPFFIIGYFGFIALFKITPEDRIVVERLRKKFGRGRKKRKRSNAEKSSQVVSAMGRKAQLS